MGERGATALLAAALLLGCGDPSPGSAPPAGSAGLPPPSPSARRPSRRYYFARAQTRCEVYIEDGQDRTEPIAAPCPEYMLIGERIRMAGRTCFLENKAQPEREKPVVCPEDLIRNEKRDRGEPR